MSGILLAAKVAREAHAGQKRKGTGRPYIEHPARVAARVLTRNDATDTVVMAALLHDVLEDSDLTYEALAASVGENVATIVGELTNLYTKEHSPELNRAHRKQAEFLRLRHTSHEAKIIKMLDRIDNLRDEGSDPDFAKLYAEESADLAEAIGDADPKLKAELLELCRRVKESK